MMRIPLFIAVSLLSGAAAADAPRATDFKWLSGCWGYERGDGAYKEHWLPATGNVILGVSQRVADGFGKEFEFLRLVTTGSGFDYIRQPQGEAEIRYGMTQVKGTEVHFESLGSSEFPTKISYEFTAPDTLTEKLEGNTRGKPVAITFPMRRIACDGK